MPDSKISNLTAATIPLAGTEVLPIVQGGATVKVSVANLTDGRDVTMANATVNGHVTILAGNLRFDDERLVYSYAGGTVGQYMSGTYYDGSGLTQRVFLNNAEVGRWTGTDLKIANGNLIIGTAGKGIDFSATPGTGTSELLADYEEGDWVPTDASGAGLTLTVTAAYYTKVGRVVTLTGRVTYPVNVSAVQARITCPFATIGPTAFVTSTNFPLTVTGYANGTSMYFYVDAQGAITNTNAATTEFNISFTYITT